jgi:phosphomannomutase/phosphoglucomutase
MHYLISNASKNQIVFGGEGSCGGFIFPYFNNTRDGIFAAAKIIEILIKTEKNISQLAKELPKYYSYRKKINIKNIDMELLIKNLKMELEQEGEQVEQIQNDLKFGHGKDWFVLIHPSNTEPIIRIISEAKRESLARVYCEAAAELVKLVISTRY